MFVILRRHSLSFSHPSYVLEISHDMSCFLGIEKNQSVSQQCLQAAHNLAVSRFPLRKEHCEKGHHLAKLVVKAFVGWGWGWA